MNTPVQSTPKDTTDYFAIFDLPRKLWIEMSELEQKFLQMSWKLHPDNFVNASEEERELSLKRSSELNDAYRTLRDPIARVEYLLAIEGERKEGEKKQQAPPELLEQVFELNESLDELREAKKKLEAAGLALEPVDHEVTKSLYFSDPDGNRIELYVDASDIWKKDPQRVAQLKPLVL